MNFEVLFWMLLTAAPVVYIVRINVKAKKHMENLLEEIRQSGFKIDHLLSGRSSLKDIGRAHRVAFDDTARQVAFVYSDTETTLRYKYEDIKEWQWKWVSINGKKGNNILHFMLRDKNRPLIQLRCVSENDAEHWMAKLDAILND